jgi:hypothetical protein
MTFFKTLGFRKIFEEKGKSMVEIQFLRQQRRLNFF